MPRCHGGVGGKLRVSQVTRRVRSKTEDTGDPARARTVALSDTFDCLLDLSEADRLAICRAALNEAHDGVQAAAVRSLIDPERLARPDLVVDQFGSLAPAAVEAARERGEVLLEVARARIRSGSGPGRLPAFRAVAALAGRAGVETLLLGLEDPMQQVRGVAFAGIAEIVRDLARSGDEAADEPGARAVWSAFERCVQEFPDHDRDVFLDLLPEFGTRSLPLIVRVLKGERGRLFVEPLTKALMKSAADGCVELVLALAAHKTYAVAMVGKRVLRQRVDGPFHVALAERMVELAENRVAEMSGEVFGEALLEAVPHLEREVAASLLEPALEQAADASEGQDRAEAFLEHPATDVQIAAVQALRRLGCPNGFEAVGRVLASFADPVRLAAAHLVIELAPENSAALLTPLLGSADPEARAIAIREVSKISLTRFLDKFDAMDQRAREVAAKALAKIDDKLIDRLGDEIGSLDAERRIRALKVVDLLQAGAELRDLLLEMLGDPDVRVRATAVRMVRLTGSVDGSKILIDALSDPDRRVRANAIEAFEQLDDPSYVDLLVPFLRDRDNRVRANAAKALWNLGWPDARDVLVAMVADEDPRMRVSAVWAIREANFLGARELLQTREIAERDPDVRAKIKEALAALTCSPQEAR